MTGPLDCLDELPLVLGAGPGNPLGNNFPLFGDKSGKSLLVLKINVNIFAVTEATRAPFLDLLILFCHG